jgi:hypothetical protein
MLALVLAVALGLAVPPTRASTVVIVAQEGRVVIAHDAYAYTERSSDARMVTQPPQEESIDKVIPGPQGVAAIVLTGVTNLTCDPDNDPPNETVSIPQVIRAAAVGEPDRTEVCRVVTEAYATPRALARHTAGEIEKCWRRWARRCKRSTPPGSTVVVTVLSLDGRARPVADRCVVSAPAKSGSAADRVACRSMILLDRIENVTPDSLHATQMRELAAETRGALLLGRPVEQLIYAEGIQPHVSAVARGANPWVAGGDLTPRRTRPLRYGAGLQARARRAREKCSRDPVACRLDIVLGQRPALAARGLVDGTRVRSDDLFGERAEEWPPRVRRREALEYLEEAREQLATIRPEAKAMSSAARARAEALEALVAAERVEIDALRGKVDDLESRGPIPGELAERAALLWRDALRRSQYWAAARARSLATAVELDALDTLRCYQAPYVARAGAETVAGRGTKASPAVAAHCGGLASYKRTLEPFVASGYAQSPRWSLPQAKALARRLVELQLEAMMLDMSHPLARIVGAPGVGLSVRDVRPVVIAILESGRPLRFEEQPAPPPGRGP